MMRLATLPLNTLRLIQRTIAAGLRAVSWISLRENCGRTLTKVNSLHFLIHFVSPERTYRQIRVGDLLELCGFQRTAYIEEAMRALQRVVKDYQQWATPSILAGDDSTAEILTNDIPTLRVIPSKFVTLCQKVLAFRQQRPTNLPVSVRRLHSRNLNSWHPEISTNAHKSGIIRSLLRTVQLQYLSHAWPDIKVATTFAKQDPNPQAGVAILIPAGWELSSQKVLVKHYAVAACVAFQACPVWLVSVYLPPKSPKALVAQIFKALLTLETHPVFIGGDFNRCDQHHPQLWEDSLGQLGVTDVDPTFPTYRFGEQQESPLDRFLVPSYFIDTTQLHVRIAGRYRVSTCHHKTVTALLSMKPRLTPHPQSEKHCTIPTKVFLDPTAFTVGDVEAQRQRALHLLRRSISLFQESCAAAVPLSTHVRALVWSWWRNSSKVFKHISPLTKLYKQLGKGQSVLHIHKETLRRLYEQSGMVELLQTWPNQHDQFLVPAWLWNFRPWFGLCTVCRQCRGPGGIIASRLLEPKISRGKHCFVVFFCCSALFAILL